MNNKKKYDNVFIENFSVSKDDLKDDIEYNSIAKWDSLGHMAFIANIEEIFDIMMDMNDIIDFSSYSKGFKILTKYGIEF